ncbi:FecR domain-containing protein [Bordetella genomosp. 12]|uniref:Heme uptake transmembrane sensor n=1 Tax=Bordetella genomosp. 12 TaxID=463035 RepID=A0A261VTY9_9BORD|nr:FecR domain-containing protein [Bordetella genomosp. 12]OZI77231.1 heme uptake transmembrane sensor [Bordetella genomosp. 12]
MTPEGTIDRRVAREAARWLMQLASGQASVEDMAACERWRARNAQHEQAWQRAQRVSDLLGGLPPELARATLGRPAFKARRAALKSLAGLILATPAAWAAWRGGEQAGLFAEYRSAPGERRDITLPDGTQVTLNSATALDLTPDGLRLRVGEIYVRAGAHACVAQTPQGQVMAQQARFALRLQDDGCRVEVYEGHVRVQPALGSPATMPAPRTAWFDSTALHALPTVPDSQPAWLRGVLQARDMSLAEFAAEIARHRRGIVRCDPAVAQLRVSGTFQLDNTAGVLRALPALLPVTVHTRTPYWVTIGPLET